MATIANLSAKVTANAAQFEGEMTKVGKAIDNVGKHITAISSPLTKFQGLLATVGVLAAGAFLASIVNAKIETLHLARALGDTVANIDMVAAALRGAGSDAAITGDVLSNLAKTIAAGATGNLVYADVFERLGLDLSKLNAMPPSQAFWVIAEAISKIGSAEQRAAIATQIFGDQAYKLMGVLSQGGKAANDARGKVEAFGKATTNMEIAQLEAAKIKFEEIEQSVKNAGLDVAVQLAPYILEIAKNVSEWANSFNQADSSIMRIGKNLAYVFVIVNNAWQAIKLVVNAMSWMIAKILLGIINVGTAIQDMMIALTNNKVGRTMLGLSKDDIAKFKQNAKDAGDAMRGAVGFFEDNMAGIVDKKVIGFDKVGEWFDGVKNNAEGAGKALNKIADAGGAVNAAFKYNPLFEKGKSVIQENATAVQKFNSTMTELDAMLYAGGAVNMGAIGWDTYGRAVAKATGELENAYNLRSLSLPTALRFGSGADVSAFNKAKLENDTRAAETPAARMERVQKQALQVSQDQLQYTRQIAQAATNRKVYDIK